MSARTLLRVGDVADYIGQSVAWVRVALADGTIPGARKVRRRWVVEKRSVDEWLDAGRPERELPEDVVPYAPPPRYVSRTVDRDAA